MSREVRGRGLGESRRGERRGAAGLSFSFFFLKRAKLREGETEKKSNARLKFSFSLSHVAPERAGLTVRAPGSSSRLLSPSAPRASGGKWWNVDGGEGTDEISRGAAGAGIIIVVVVEVELSATEAVSASLGMYLVASVATSWFLKRAMT